MLENLKVSRVLGRGGCRIGLEGVIDERCDLKEHFEGLTGTVVVDLDQVPRITSFGILQWRSALEKMAAVYYAFIRCRPAMLSQFNLIEGFGGRGELVSFYLPYICSSCSHEFQLLLDLRHHYSVALSREPPHARCRQCDAEAEFDGIPEEFFSFVGSRPRPHLPPIALPLIDGMLGDLPERLKIRKEVDGSVTSMAFAGPLNGEARISPATEGVEGFLLVDFSEVSSIDDAGMQALTNAVAAVSVAQCCYTKLPIPLLDSFVANFERSHASAGLVSVLVRDQCPKCRTDMDFDLQRTGLTDRGAEASCEACSTMVRLEMADQVLRALREILVEPAPPVAAFLGGRTGASSVPRPIVDLEEGTLGPLVGESPAFREIVETLQKVAPTNATVMLRGETGTGKEMLARLVHQLSPRRDKPFVPVNCAALSEGLIESELFGHERGAFTGAAEQTLGRFERADGGTLFIDEIGDLPASVQVKLLRALQEKSIERVGGSAPIPIDIRLIAATHQPLEQMMENGEFREDLYYRISVVPVYVPPLRHRRTDIWPIALHYLAEIQQRSGRNGIRLSERMRAALEAYSWPGNVRELINVVDRAVALTPSLGTADLVDFGPKPLPSDGHEPGHRANGKWPPTEREATLKDAVGSYERRLIVEALERTNGNRTRAAQNLGISRQALGMKLHKYGLS